MQLIWILLFVFVFALFVCTTLFVVRWYRAHRAISIVPMLREGIGHIGISAIVEYPKTLQPLLALLEEEYPYSEAIVIVDMQQPQSPFTALLQRFSLVKVNHSHLKDVRALYRSKHRAFRRVVVIDLPLHCSNYAELYGRAVATFDYTLYLRGESLVARNALTYCANIAAMHYASPNTLLESFVGASARFERTSAVGTRGREQIVADRILAWQKESMLPLLLALLAPAILVVLAYFAGEWILLVAAGTASLIVLLMMYVSYHLMTEKSLFVTLNTILKNFYRYLVREVKNFDYLYRCSRQRDDIAEPMPIRRFAKRKINNRKQL